MKERNYGIELLRLVLMFMVCMLHVLGQGGVLSSCASNTYDFKFYWLIEIACYCAVDAFAIISGYFASDRPQKYSKIIMMWFQVVFYSFLLTAVLDLCGADTGLALMDYKKLIMPITYSAFWYFTAFFVVFMVAPLLNKFIFSLDEKGSRTALAVTLLMFCTFSVFIDPFKLGSGYSALWLVVLYCVGGLAARCRLFEKKKSITLIIVWALCIGITWALKIFCKYSKLLSYTSPTIVLSGIIMVVLFSRLKLKGVIIKKLSPLAFGIYLFQNSFVIWNVYLPNAFSKVGSMNLALGTVIVFGGATAIFLSGMAVEFIRQKLAKLFRIDKLSEKLADLLKKSCEKISLVLK